MSATTTIPIDEIRCRVFRRRTTTAEQEAQPYSYPELVGLLKSVRRELRSLVAELPDSAFEPQPDNANGNDRWTAGQIVSHLIEAALRFDFYCCVRTLAGLGNYELPKDFQSLRGEEPLTRPQTLFALDLADRELEQLQADLPDTVNVSTTSSAPPFGELSIRGWLLLTSLHEGMHVERLRQLNPQSELKRLTRRWY